MRYFFRFISKIIFCFIGNNHYICRKFINRNIMTAVQLNAELLRELSAIAEDESLMTKVLQYIKKLTAKKPDPTSMTKEEFLEKLEKGEEEYRQGKCVRLQQGETLSEMLRRSGL